MQFNARWYGFSSPPPLPLELVEKTSPFWLRYQERYVYPDNQGNNGRQIIWGSFDCSDKHDAMIKEDYFNYVAFTQRNTIYKNRRGLDPQVKMFMDQEHLRISPEWNLPVPNEDAAFISLSKYGKAEVRLNEKQILALNKAWRWTENHFMPYMGNSRIVSLQEAVDRLDLSSSSGFPFNREFPLKRDLFENDPDIIPWLEQDWELLATDPMWTTIATSSLKEELRPEEKIKLNSQRTFTAFAVDGTVQGTRLFVDQNEKMYAAHTVTSSSIGMSPLKGNWDKLHRKLSVFKNGYALDESQFDSSLRRFLILGCASLRWKFYSAEFKTPETMQRLKTYYRNIISTLVITPEGIMVMKKLGMPSGCVNTVTDNTLILHTMLAYAWILNAPEDMNNYQDFNDHTAKALLGDDNTWTVSNDAHVFFNGPSVIETWKTLGITTTTDSLEPRIAEDLDFLSAHTVFIKGCAVPLYSRDKLMTSLLFAPQKHITPATTLQRCTNLLQIGWTDLPFRQFCRELISWLIAEYDHVLIDDPRWIIAKSGIFTDEMYYILFTGRKSLFIDTQSYQETQERLKSLITDSRSVMSTNAPPRKSTQSRRSRRPRNRGPKKGKSNGPKPKPSSRNQQRPRRRNKPRNSIARNAQAETSSKYMGGTVIRNVKRLSKPEPFSGDELIGTLMGSVAFATQGYVLNPGNPTTFPWFNKIASLYERYKFTMLEFYYQHDVSQFNAQGAAGLVILSALYDAAASPPTTKQQIEVTDPRVICMPNENSVLMLANQGMHPVGEPKFVRGASLPGATDIKTYDAGTLYATTQGMAGSTEVGELHVRYKGFLYDRILDSSAAQAPQNFSVSQLVSTVNLALTSGNSANLAFANTTPADGYNNGLGLVNAAGQMTLPAGNYMVQAQAIFVFTGSGTSAVVNVQKNTAGVTATIPGEVFVAAQRTQLTLNDFSFVTSNGTDYVNIATQANFTTGTCVVTGSVMITAI